MDWRYSPHSAKSVDTDQQGVRYCPMVILQVWQSARLGSCSRRGGQHAAAPGHSLCSQFTISVNVQARSPSVCKRARLAPSLSQSRAKSIFWWPMTENLTEIERLLPIRMASSGCLEPTRGCLSSAASLGTEVAQSHCWSMPPLRSCSLHGCSIGSTTPATGAKATTGSRP